MLCPIYHQIILPYGFAEDEDQMPWHKQPTPKPSVESERAKILWDIPIYLDVTPENGANKPDLVVLDKDKDTWRIVQGNVCNTGYIHERTLYKQEKYTDLRSGLKRLYPNHKAGQVNVVLDFLRGYNKQLLEDLEKVGLNNVKNLIRQCQKWIILQNCEIVKAFHTYN